jgi:hypothetical protein
MDDKVEMAVSELVALLLLIAFTNGSITKGFTLAITSPVYKVTLSFNGD